MKLPLTIKVFYEGSSKDAPWVSYNPELDVASCGPTEKKARENLKEAIDTVLKGAKVDGNLEALLRESGFNIEKGKVLPPPKSPLRKLPSRQFNASIFSNPLAKTCQNIGN